MFKTTQFIEVLLNIVDVVYSWPFIVIALVLMLVDSCQFIAISALLSAAIFGNVSSIMLRIYQGTDEYHEKMQSIKDFINFHHLPKHLANRLQESFTHAWSYTKGIDMNAVKYYLKSNCLDNFHVFA